MTTVCAVFLTNGRRDCVEQTFHTWAPLIGQCTDGVVVDDSGDPEYSQWVSAYTGLTCIAVDEKPAGYYRAMATVWDVARRFDYIFLIEDDFILKAKIDLYGMVSTLDAFPELQQLVLLRQAWFGNEVQAGGLIPALRAMGHAFSESNGVLTHRATWSTNPTLFRGREWVEKHPWPQHEGSEYRFGQELFAESPDNVCAYWAYSDQDISVEHIGQRAGFGH